MTDVLDVAGHVDVIAVGKASAAMLGALTDGPARPLRRLLGIGPGDRPAVLPPQAEWLAGPHPLPDQRSVRAAERALDIARAAGERDVLLVLLSGGGSAMMALPVSGVSLEDKQRTVRTLLLRGADIYELNGVRKHLSAIKGGRLAAASPARIVTLAISDVIGDDLSVIASGPTVPDASTFEAALDVLDRRGGRATYPASIRAHLQKGAAGEVEETPKVSTNGRDVDARVIGSIATAISGAATAAAALGYAVHVLPRRLVGEARAAAGVLADSLLEIPRAGHRVCVIGGGETTVAVVGTGTGGRSQELALALALRLETTAGPVAALSAGTDGIDGPTDAAGAIVDSGTLVRARAAGLDASRYLDNNDSYTFFAHLGDLVRTGPTGTNVGDLQVLLAEAW